MGNTYHIRPLTIEDFDDLIVLWDRAKLSYRPKGRDTREHIAGEMAVDNAGWIGMFDGDRLIAFVLANFDGRKGWINRLAVDPDYRGRGLAIQMVGEAERVLADHFGAEITVALVEPENIASKNLFMKCDYKIWEGMYYFSKRKHPDV